MQFWVKKQALYDLLQNTAIVLAIEALRSRHSQIERSHGSAVGHERAGHAHSQAWALTLKRFAWKTQSPSDDGACQKDSGKALLNTCEMMLHFLITEHATLHLEHKT